MCGLSGATEHSGPGRTTALYSRDIFFKRQRRLPLQIRSGGGKFKLCCNKDAGAENERATYGCDMVPDGRRLEWTVELSHFLLRNSGDIPLKERG